MAAPRSSCQDCGAGCRGDRCQACYKAQFAERYRPCETCGKPCLGRHCQSCWRGRPLDFQPGPCAVCRADLATHTRCRSCDILAGPGHYVTSLLPNGQCASCAEWVQKQRRWAA